MRKIKLTDDDYQRGNILLSQFLFKNQSPHCLQFHKNWNQMWKLFETIKDVLGFYPEVNLHGFTNISWWYRKNNPNGDFDSGGKFFDYTVYHKLPKDDLSIKGSGSYVIYCDPKQGPINTAWYACVIWVLWYNKTTKPYKSYKRHVNNKNIHN